MDFTLATSILTVLLWMNFMNQVNRGSNPTTLDSPKFNNDSNKNLILFHAKALMKFSHNTFIWDLSDVASWMKRHMFHYNHELRVWKVTTYLPRVGKLPWQRVPMLGVFCLEGYEHVYETKLHPSSCASKCNRIWGATTNLENAPWS